jgi:hypothetical protein
MDMANSEVNLVWKQAVRLSLIRSINSAKLILANDREISSQKKEQLIVVIELYGSRSARSKPS